MPTATASRSTVVRVHGLLLTTTADVGRVGAIFGETRVAFLHGHRQGSLFCFDSIAWRHVYALVLFFVDQFMLRRLVWFPFVSISNNKSDDDTYLYPVVVLAF